MATAKKPATTVSKTKVATPKAAKPKIATPKSATPKVTAPKTTAPKAAKPKSATTKAATPKASAKNTPPKQAKLGLDEKATNKPVATKKSVSPEERYQMIAAAAYFHAERHGFTSGRSLDDWIAAEKEIDQLLKS